MKKKHVCGFFLQLEPKIEYNFVTHEAKMHSE